MAGQKPIGEPYTPPDLLLNAIADAVGEDAFRRAPVSSDVVLTSLEEGRGSTSSERTSDCTRPGTWLLTSSLDDGIVVTEVGKGRRRWLAAGFRLRSGIGWVTKRRLD